MNLYIVFPRNSRASLVASADRACFKDVPDHWFVGWVGEFPRHVKAVVAAVKRAGYRGIEAWAR